jgi:hypothetical protein
VLEHLKRLIARLRSSGGPFPPLPPLDDPDVGVRQPRWLRPSSGSTAVAVAEPDGEEFTVPGARVSSDRARPATTVEATGGRRERTPNSAREAL